MKTNKRLQRGTALQNAHEVKAVAFIFEPYSAFFPIFSKFGVDLNRALVNFGTELGNMSINYFSESHALLLKLILQYDKALLDFFSLKLVFDLLVDELAYHTDLKFLVSHFFLQVEQCLRSQVFLVKFILLCVSCQRLKLAGYLKGLQHLPPADPDLVKPAVFLVLLVLKVVLSILGDTDALHAVDLHV